LRKSTPFALEYSIRSTLKTVGAPPLQTAASLSELLETTIASPCR
jgi:hypothetical protein